MTVVLRTIVCLGAVAALACGQRNQASSGTREGSSQSEGAASAQPKPSAQAKPTAQPSAAAAGPVVEDEAFVLKAVTEKAYEAGKRGSFTVQVNSRGKWHLNRDFPWEVTPASPSGAVQFTAKSVTKEDAEAFGENEAKLKVPFTASQAGTHSVRATVSFAVCTKNNCVPDERELAVALAVR